MEHEREQYITGTPLLSCIIQSLEDFKKKGMTSVLLLSLIDKEKEILSAFRLK